MDSVFRNEVGNFAHISTKAGAFVEHPSLWATGHLFVSKGVFGDYSFSPTETNSINYISNLCPSIYGMCVYKARGLKSAMRPDSVFFYADDCNISYRLKHPNDLGLHRVTVYPNPTTGHLTIMSDNTGKNDMLALRLTDVLGREFLPAALPSGSNSWDADISDYPAGIYLVSVAVNGRTEKITEITLIH